MNHGYSNVKISYFPTSVKKLYKVDDQEWSNYDNQVIRLEIGQQLQTKGVDKYGKETEVISYTSVLPDDALGLNAYDENKTTVENVNGKIKIIDVSKEMIGKKITLTGNSSAYREGCTIKFIAEDGSIISSNSIGTNPTYTIPTGTVKVKFDAKVEMGKINIYELSVVNTPVLSIEKNYPKLTEYGMNHGYSNVKISYFPTSVKKLYKVDDQEWSNYDNQVIRLEIGQQLQTKGVDKYGKETEVISYTSVLPDDALGLNAYDENKTTVENVNGKIKIIDVSKEMIGKKITLTGNSSAYREGCTIKFIAEDGSIISSNSIGTNPTYTIPTGTVKVKFDAKVEMGKINIYEITPSTLPIINEIKYYPTLSSDGVVATYSKISITYLSYFSKKLYSLDNGTTWLDYTKPFEAVIGTKLLAKAIDPDGTETEVSNYTVVGLSDNISKEVFDNDKSTSTSIAKNTTKSFSLNNVASRTLRIYTTGTVASNSFIKLFDASNKELANVSLSSNITTLVIPDGSVKASIYSGTSALKVTEINLRDNTVSNNVPEININDTNWAVSKTIDIIYPEGYKNEYSLDLGETWIEYLSPITVDKPTVIIARVVDNEKIVSSSSFNISKVDSVEPTIELNLPDRLVQDFDFQLPTKYTFGISGVTVVCKDGENVVTSTKNLEIGSHEIVCNIETGAGINKTVSKNVVIIEAEDGDITNYDYTGDEQTYTINKTGLYQLETWGASGGCSLNNNKEYCNDIGYGGYSVGTVLLNKDTILYINVGGKGTNGTLKSVSSGGYNGGGSGTWDNSDDEASGGGGATHIATSTGLLSTFENNLDSLLIVSGGGGGKSWTYAVGSAGGFKGGKANTTNQSEVSQTKGYAFGQGQNASGTGDSTGVGGGGGGLYGGYMNNVVGKSCGSGGSSYIGNKLLTNKVMYCYNCESSNDESIKTISTTNISEEAVSTYVKKGNGYARITYIGE